MAQLVFGAGNSTGFGTTGTSTAITASFSKASLSNMVVGDLLVAWVHNQQGSSGNTITAPAGWTRYGAALATPNPATSRTSGFYYYALKSQADIDAIPATPTWTFGLSGGRVACVVARATGIDLDAIEDSASASFTGSSNASSLTIPGITTVKPSTLLLAGIYHANSVDTVSPTVTSLLTSFTGYKTVPTGSTLANSGGVMGYKNVTTAGTTGTVVATFDASVVAMGGELVAFKAGSWSPPVTQPEPIGTPIIVGTPTTFLSASAIKTFTINKPTGYQNGDVLVLALSAQSPTITADYASAGWSRISTAFTPSSAGYRLVAFYALPVPNAAALTATTFTFTSTDSAGGRVCAEILIVRGADLTQLVSATSPYGSTSGQTVTVQPTIPAVNNNLLLVAYNANFTAAIDYSITSGPSGMTQQNYLISSTIAQSKTALAVYTQSVDAGAVTPKTLTWAGIQSQTSGAAVAIRALGATTPPPNAGIGAAIKYTSAPGTLNDGKLYYTSAPGTLATPKEIRPVPTGYASINDMLSRAPFYVAHRGGSTDWPEMSLHAYTQSVFWGMGALELSLARTSDGVWFGLHDATLDRTSATSGFTASAHTWAEVQAYQITATATTNPGQPVKPYMRWEEIIAAYYHSHVIFVDPKVASGKTTELLNMMDALPGNPRERLVAKYFGTSGNTAGTTGWAAEARARGYKTWGYFYQADVPTLDTYQGRWDILGMDVNANQASWDKIKSYGKKVIGHTPANAAAATTGFTKGADGLMVAGVQLVVPRSV